VERLSEQQAEWAERHASETKVLMNGNLVNGVEKIKWSIKKNINRNFSIGGEEFIGQYAGQLLIDIWLQVRSGYKPFDDILQKPPSQLVLFSLMIDFGSQGTDKSVGKITFDGCLPDSEDFEMVAPEIGRSLYHLTAVRARKESS
jgi:hypothetical protein